MSVVIIGGHDRMVSQYKKICKNYNCKAKVFTQMSASLDKQIGRLRLRWGQWKWNWDRSLSYQQWYCPYWNLNAARSGIKSHKHKKQDCFHLIISPPDRCQCQWPQSCFSGDIDVFYPCILISITGQTPYADPVKPQLILFQRLHCTFHLLFCIKMRKAETHSSLIYSS